MSDYAPNAIGGLIAKSNPNATFGRFIRLIDAPTIFGTFVYLVHHKQVVDPDP